MIPIQGIESLDFTKRVEGVRQRIAEIEERFGIGGEGGSFRATLEREIARNQHPKKTQPTQKSAEVQRMPGATRPVNENEAGNAAKVTEAINAANNSTAINSGEKVSGIEKSSDTNTQNFTHRKLPGEEVLQGRINLNPAENNPAAAISAETAEEIESKVPTREDKVASVESEYNAESSVAEILETAAQKYGVDPNLVKAIATAESNMNGEAISPVGAIGVMQLMPETAAGLGVDPYDDVQNIDGGTRYLKQMLDTFGGNVRHAVAAYNAGPGAVSKYGGVPPYAETQNYVGKVMDMYR